MATNTAPAPHYPEWNYYESRLAEWRRTHANEWVCILGREEGGFFKTQSAAIAHGTRKWKNRSFAVFQVGMVQQKVSLNDLIASA
jgi:hypothetical protein